MITHGDLFDVLPTLDAESVDVCVTDPPYGIGFMGREWDTFKPEAGQKRIVQNKHADSDNPNLKGRTRGPASSPSSVEYDYSYKGLQAFQAWTERWAREVFRVLKPGGYLLACGAPRSFHREACGIEDADFEIRDTLSWLFGQGFPKSLNISGGRGTALKPGWEPVIMARKPLRGTVAKNAERFGTGVLNIDACRIEGDVPACTQGQSRNAGTIYGHDQRDRRTFEPHDAGRWPANVLLDEEAAAMLDAQSGELVSGANPTRRGSDKFRGIYQPFQGQTECEAARGMDFGGASRFFYCAKPSREERDLGCDWLTLHTPGECTDRKEGSAGLNSPRAGAGRTGGGRNIHPTVKPLALMRYLVRLVTPPGGLVLDPFTGSGTTGMACAAEGLRFFGVEREAEYFEIAQRRIAAIAPLFTEDMRL